MLENKGSIAKKGPIQGARAWLESHLSLFVVILVGVQPLLDVLSYFMQQGGGNALTTALRTVLLFTVCAYGLAIAENRRPYLVLYGAVGVFWLAHALNCLRLGYLDTMRSYGVFDGHAYTFVKGTISDEMQRYYGQFYARMDLLGFRNVRRRFLQSAAYAAVTRQVYRRSSRKTPVRAFALDGIESAAELLGLNPCVLYSADRLHERLSEAVQAVELPASLSGEGGAVPLGLSALADALRLADRPCRLRFLARTIRSALDRAEPVSLLPVAALLPGEFSAALYLAFSRFL